MEEFRDERLSRIVSWMQAFVRGFLSRRDYKKLQEQRLALQVVQRNLRRYLKLRTWPWWKLWQKIRPLLNATRIEDELAVSIYKICYLYTTQLYNLLYIFINIPTCVWPKFSFYLFFSKMKYFLYAEHQYLFIKNILWI